MDSRCLGRCPVNGLKVDGQVVEQGEEGTRKASKLHTASMALFFSILKVSCAFSPCHHSFNMKTKINTGKRTNTAITEAEFQALVVPLHSMARR